MSRLNLPPLEISDAAWTAFTIKKEAARVQRLRQHGEAAGHWLEELDALARDFASDPRMVECYGSYAAAYQAMTWGRFPNDCNFLGDDDAGDS